MNKEQLSYLGELFANWYKQCLAVHHHHSDADINYPIGADYPNEIKYMHNRDQSNVYTNSVVLLGYAAAELKKANESLHSTYDVFQASLVTEIELPKFKPNKFFEKLGDMYVRYRQAEYDYDNANEAYVYACGNKANTSVKLYEMLKQRDSFATSRNQLFNQMVEEFCGLYDIDLEDPIALSDFIEMKS